MIDSGNPKLNAIIAAVFLVAPTFMTEAEIKEVKTMYHVAQTRAEYIVDTGDVRELKIFSGDSQIVSSYMQKILPVIHKVGDQIMLPGDREYSVEK